MRNEVKAIICGRLIDGSGNPQKFNQVVLIEGSLIKDVGEEGEVRIPEGAKIIDASDKTVMPGLIDAHIHFLGMKTDRWIEEQVAQASQLGLIRSVIDARKLLEAGYTTVRDCGSINGLYIREAIKEGIISGPRVLAAGFILSQTFGHVDIHYLPLEWVDARKTKRGYTLICDGVSECIKAARYALRQGADFIKICTTGGVLSMNDRPEYTQFTLKEIKAIVEEAAHVGRFVSSHSMGTEGIKNAIKGGVKVIEHAWYPDDDAIRLAKEKGVIFVPTLSYDLQIIRKGEEAGYPSWAVEKEKEAWDQVVKNIAKAHKEGVIMASGTDFVGSPISRMGTNCMELELLVKYCGFTPMEAIVAATANGAEACGLKRKIGTIEPGKIADIIVVDGDPLKDIRILQDVNKIKLVMKDGKKQVDRGL